MRRDDVHLPATPDQPVTGHDVHGWHVVARAPARPVLVEQGLVLSALDIPHTIDFDGHQWLLRVPVGHVQQAHRELSTYGEENRRPVPDGPRVVPAIDSGWIGVLGYLLVIWSLPWLEGTGLPGLAWRADGGLVAGLVQDGEWWRAITALTLHADLGHIAGNSLFGAIFGLLAGRMYGSGAAWLLVLAAGALGNLLNAQLQGSEFRAIGASTATFAALALVAFGALRRGWFRAGSWRRTLAPLYGGIALLVYTGLGGDDARQIDVMGHLCGFAAGALLGWLVPPAVVIDGGRWLQSGAGLLAFGAVVLAWWLALAGG